MQKARLDFVEWLRIFLIGLVVAHHAGQPYGPTGGAWPVDDPTSSDVLLPFFAVNAAFFMGFFFLISGYFTEGSYDRHGVRGFLISRFVRLGLPILFFVVFLNGLIAFGDSATERGYLAFLWHDYTARGMEFGHLWFIAHLLVYALLYALWRMIAPKPSPSAAPPPPGHLAIAAFVLALTAVTFAVRTVWPQDVWVRLLWFIPAEPMHLPQYASLFVIGIVASHGDWFTAIPKRTGYIWFWIATAAFIVAVGLIAADVRLPGFREARDLWKLVDSLVCVGMILGLLVFFREHANRTRPIARRLAASVYGIYLVHIYVVVAIQTPLVETPLGALTKFAIVTLLGLVISFVIVDTLRRIKPLRQVI
jgi:glucan biosynthesis protein C